MRCPFCDFPEDKVVDSRVTQGGDVIRRRRECLDCSARFTTYERVEETFPQIVKRDGSRVDYNRQKVHRGIRIACSKRPVTTSQIDDVVNRLEAKLLGLNSREVESDWVGTAVTEELRELDPVAYIRFASVYRDFQDVQEFLDELNRFEESGDASRSGDSGNDGDE